MSICLLITFSTVLRYFPFEYLLTCSNILLLIIIYLAWSPIWNLGLVISILEWIYRVNRLGSTTFLGLRNFQNWVILMLMFSIWELGLGFLCLTFGYYKIRLGIYIQIGLFCMGHALKCASFVM